MVRVKDKLQPLWFHLLCTASASSLLMILLLDHLYSLNYITSLCGVAEKKIQILGSAKIGLKFTFVTDEL